MIDGRIKVGEKDYGSGFCIADLMVVTAAHVIGDLDPADLCFQISGDRVGVESVRIKREIDVALLHLKRSLAAVPRLTHSAPSARWRVLSQPLGNDPELRGEVTTKRRITNVHDYEVQMLQLKVDEALGYYEGYSGSAVYIGEAVTGVLLEQVRERPGRGAVPRGTNVLYAVPIEQVVQTFGLNRAICSYEPEPPPSGVLLDAAYFDLDTVKACIRTALQAADGNAIAFATPCAEPIFIRKLCDWLAHHLGEAHRRDQLLLDPALMSVGSAARTVLRYRAALDRMNVVCPVSADRVSGEFVAGFWAQVCADLKDTDGRLVLLFAGVPDGGYPQGIHRLPPPSYQKTDVETWARQVGAIRDWDPRLTDVLRDLIVEESSNGDGDGDGDGLSVRFIIESLEDYIKLIQFHPDELRHDLERRSRHAHAASR